MININFMEAKKINVDKILEKISKEEKFQKEKYKQLWFNRLLKTSQRKKLCDIIQKSEDNVTKLKEKLKGKI